MKIYLSSMKPEYLVEHHRLFPGAKINSLVSYGSQPQKKITSMMSQKDYTPFGSVILDSGTWALNNSNSDITMQGYKEHLTRYGYLYNHYFSFDEDHTSEGWLINWMNQRSLEQDGFSPIPVVHDIDGDEIERFIDHGYKYVALGSAQITKQETLGRVMEKFIKAEIKVHLFGSTCFDYLARFPIYSCDSSGWSQLANNGWLNYWNPDSKGLNKSVRFQVYSRPSICNKNSLVESKDRDSFLSYIDQKMDIKYLDLINSGPLQHLVNIHHALQMERAINDIHREKGFYTAE